MKKFLAHDPMNGEYEYFDTIEEARAYLEESFLDKDEGYHPDLKLCKIFKLAEVVDYKVIDSKSNYKYEDEEDIPEGEETEEAWPYSSTFHEIWEHKFVPVK